MKAFTLSLIFLLLSSCAQLRVSSDADKKRFRTVKVSKMTEDEELKKLIKRKISRNGKYSIVSQDLITKEKYTRPGSHSVITREKGELRIETEKNNSGRVITKTWQDGILTSFTVSRPERSILILFDRKGNFVHKIVTREGDETPDCYHYTGTAVMTLSPNECLDLLPGFD